MARLGYSPTAQLAAAMRELLVAETRAAESEKLTQRGIAVIEELRRVNKELAD